MNRSLTFHARDPQQLHVRLELLHAPVHRLLTVFYVCLRQPVALLPSLELAIIQLLLSNNECPESLISEVLASLIDGDPLIGHDALLHDGLSALEVEYESLGLGVLEDYAHAFGLRAEWEVGEDLILLVDAGSVLNDHPLLVPLQELHAHRVIRELDQSDLVGGARLEVSQRRVVGVRVGRSHVVAQGQTGQEVAHHVVLLPTVRLLRLLRTFVVVSL